MRKSRSSKEGASILETFLAMILLCFILFGILQVSLVTAAHDVLIYAASAGARCRTIGYSDHMVAKTIRGAALPNMGAKQISLGEETYRLKDYLMYETSADSKTLLDHISVEYWNSLEDPEVSDSTDFVKVNLLQEFPLTMPFRKFFYNVNYTELSTEKLTDGQGMILENHSELYLQ